MITINKLVVKGSYKYVWLKYVNSVDLSQHCARCLNGTYESRINANTHSYSDLKLKQSKYYYFCTVGQYETNIHIAFREKTGSKIVIDNEYCYVEISNAEQIIFDNSRIDWTLPQAAHRYYNTCRNWWFANWIKNEVGYGKG